MKRASTRLDAVGLRITNAVGTMWCAIAFAAIAFVSLPASIASGSVVVIIGWFAQTFLQLVLLSVIMVGQRLQADSHADLHEKVDALHDKVDVALGDN